MNIDSTGQFASVLRQAPSSNSFLAVAHTLVFTVTPVNTGESGDFSASATVSTFVSSILLCLQTSANMVTAQSAKAITASSRAVGPVSFPPAEVERSQTTLCVLELSATDRTFSIHLAVALIFGARANDSEFASFLVFDQVFQNISAYDATIILANDTTFDPGGEQNCSWMNQNYNWSNRVFKDRCGELLNRATNLVADVLHTFIMRVRPAGDVNGDDRVDMKDVSYVARRFLLSPGDQLWDPAADLNGDGKIDMKDVAIPSQHFPYP